MGISAISSGLSAIQAAMAQMEASASNIANVTTSGTVPGSTGGSGSSVYQPISVQQYDTGGGVGYSFSRDASAYFQSYDPTSPSADAAGMVAIPAVDLASQLVSVDEARLQFTAATKVVRAAADLQKTAIDMTA